MANKRVFKLATASAVAASALVAAVPASAASVTYEQASAQVEKARAAANGLHADYTRNADYKTVVDSKEARDELARAKAKIAALKSAKEKAYLNTRIQGTIDTVARANAYNNAVRVATEFLPKAKTALETALVNVDTNVAAAEAAKANYDTYVKQAEINFGKVYGATIQAKFKSEYLTTAVYNLQKEAVEKIADAKLGPAVKSVSAINGTTLQVTFNKAVNASDLIDGAGVIKPAALTVSKTASAATVTATNLKGSLSADGKVLTVTVTGGTEYLNGTYAVELLKDTVKLKDDASKFIEAYKTLVEASDVTGPSITGVTYDGSTATVTFSEALKSEGTVSVNGVQQASGTGYDAFTAGGKTLKINNLQAGSSHTLTVVGAKDVAGNYTSPNALSYTLTPPSDSVKPTVALSVSGTKVTFDFSEDLKLVDADGDLAVSEFAKVTLGNGTPIYLTATEQDADDASKFVVDFNGSVTGDFLNSSVKVESFVDKAGNAGSTATTAVTLTKDKTAPTFVSAMTKDDKLIVKYNEDVANASLAAGDLSIKYVDSDGVLTPAAVPTAIGAVADFYDANGNGRTDGDEENYIVIPLTGSQFVTGTKLKAGTYTVTVATDKVVDTSVAGNKASSSTFTVSVAGDSASSAIVELTGAAQQASPGQIKVTFNNNMGTSALVAANYKLGGTTLPSGATLTFLVDKKNVLITLPAGYVTANGDRVFEVSNLTDIDGNTLKSGKTSVVASAVLENVAPTATKVSLVDGQNLTVDFSEVLAALPTVSGVKVKVNGSEIALDGTTPFALDGTKKVVTIKASSATAFKLSDVITVEFSNSNIKDVAGNTVANVTLSK